MSIESAVPDAGRCDSDNAICMVGSKTAATPIAIMTAVLDFKIQIYVPVVRPVLDTDMELELDPDLELQ